MTYDEAVALMESQCWLQTRIEEAKLAIYDLLDQFPGSELACLQNVRARMVDGSKYYETSEYKGCLKCQLTAWATGQPATNGLETGDYMVARGVPCNPFLVEEKWYVCMSPYRDKQELEAAYTITEHWLLEYIRLRAKTGPEDQHGDE